jgi:hypothetical protein
MDRLGDLEARVGRLEELQRGYRDVLEDDPEAVEQTAQILQLVRRYPGASQRGICHGAREKYGIARGRALEILKRETGVLWRTTDGAFNAKLYYERERNTSGTGLAQQADDGEQ